MPVSVDLKGKYLKYNVYFLKHVYDVAKKQSNPFSK